jgi:hypothetical protein
MLRTLMQVLANITRIITGQWVGRRKCNYLIIKYIEVRHFYGSWFP